MGVFNIATIGIPLVTFIVVLVIRNRSMKAVAEAKKHRDQILFSDESSFLACRAGNKGSRRQHTQYIKNGERLLSGSFWDVVEQSNRRS